MAEQEREREKYIYFRVSGSMQKIRIGVKFGIAVYPSSTISKWYRTLIKLRKRYFTELLEARWLREEIGHNHQLLYGYQSVRAAIQRQSCFERHGNTWRAIPWNGMSWVCIGRQCVAFENRAGWPEFCCWFVPSRENTLRFGVRILLVFGVCALLVHMTVILAFDGLNLH